MSNVRGYLIISQNVALLLLTASYEGSNFMTPHMAGAERQRSKAIGETPGIVYEMHLCHKM